MLSSKVLCTFSSCFFSVKSECNSWFCFAKSSDIRIADSIRWRVFSRHFFTDRLFRALHSAHSSEFRSNTRVYFLFGLLTLLSFAGDSFLCAMRMQLSLMYPALLCSLLETSSSSSVAERFTLDDFELDWIGKQIAVILWITGFASDLVSILLILTSLVSNAFSDNTFAAILQRVAWFST